MVAEVARGSGIGIAPLFGGLAEEGDVEQEGVVFGDLGGLGRAIGTADPEDDFGWHFWGSG